MVLQVKMCDSETFLENEQSEATQKSSLCSGVFKFEMLQKSDIINNVHSLDKKNRQIM